MPIPYVSNDPPPDDEDKERIKNFRPRKRRDSHEKWPRKYELSKKQLVQLSNWSSTPERVGYAIGLILFGWALGFIAESQLLKYGADMSILAPYVAVALMIAVANAAIKFHIICTWIWRLHWDTRTDDLLEKQEEYLRHLRQGVSNTSKTFDAAIKVSGAIALATAHAFTTTQPVLTAGIMPAELITHPLQWLGIGIASSMCLSDPTLIWRIKGDKFGKDVILILGSVQTSKVIGFLMGLVAVSALWQACQL